MVEEAVHCIIALIDQYRGIYKLFFNNMHQRQVNKTNDYVNDCLLNKKTFFLVLYQMT